jgi:hypothetical protein
MPVIGLEQHADGIGKLPVRQPPPHHHPTPDWPPEPRLVRRHHVPPIAVSGSTPGRAGKAVTCGFIIRQLNVSASL